MTNHPNRSRHVIRVLQGPAGSHGFRTGWWLVQRGATQIEVFDSVPHGLEQSEQDKRVAETAARSFASLDAGDALHPLAARHIST
jgi:hypothetical protein